MQALKWWLTLLFAMLSTVFVYSQDPFFLGSRQIPSYINPALTGMYGSWTVHSIAKEQYFKTKGFRSYGISLESSHPCFRTDWGIYYIDDVEGASLFRTRQVGGNFVHTLPFENQKKQRIHNFRIGLRLQFQHKSLDWEDLTFSDQLEEAYGMVDVFGTPNASSFIPPEGNGNWQLTSGLGFIHRVEIGLQNKVSMLWGMGFENYTNISEGVAFDSVLGLEHEKKSFINKFSIYVNPEFPIIEDHRKFIVLEPSYLFQRHNKLTHQQFGVDMNLDRVYGVGLYFSMASPELANFLADTKTLILDVYFPLIYRKGHQVNFGIQYMHNVGGLSSAFSQSVQVGIRWHSDVNGCGTIISKGSGRGNCWKSVPYARKMKYKNIWFRSLEGKNK